MTHIEHHWQLISSQLDRNKLSVDELDFYRELFFGGALSMLAILAKLNNAELSDWEFNRRMDELFREASIGVLKRYRERGCVIEASSRRH